MESPSAGCPPTCSTPSLLVSPTPSQGSLSAKQPMSATLRERLKKTRRSFTSFSTVAKRLKVDSEDNKSAPSENMSLLKTHTLVGTEHSGEETVGETILKSGKQGGNWLSPKTQTLADSSQVVTIDTEVNEQELPEVKRRLMKQVQEKEELLRRLKMVKTYRSKNNMTELQSLIEKWRNSSQQMLYELQSALSAEGKKMSLSQLIDSCGLEDSLLHYNRTEEDFEDP